MLTIGKIATFISLTVIGPPVYAHHAITHNMGTTQTLFHYATEISHFLPVITTILTLVVTTVGISMIVRLSLLKLQEYLYSRQ